MSFRNRVKELLVRYLIRDLTFLVLSYLREREIFIRSWGRKGSNISEFNNPIGIAFFNSEIFVSDTYNNRIQVFTLEGKFLRSWGKPGDGYGEFRYPHGIAISSCSFSGFCKPEVAVVDSYNCRIQFFNLEGKFLRSWGTNGSGAGKFNLPRRIVYLPSKNVAVTDIGNRCVQIFTREGKFVQFLGNVPQENKAGLFNSPHGIICAPSGEILVADSFNNQIQIFSSEGKHLRVLDEKKIGNDLDYPKGISVLPSGEIVIANAHSNRIQVLSAGTSEGKLLRSWGNKGMNVGEFNYPENILAVPSGEIIVVDQGNHRLQVFSTILD